MYFYSHEIMLLCNILDYIHYSRMPTVDANAVACFLTPFYREFMRHTLKQAKLFLVH